jgi:hypothetical protein
MPAPSQLIQDAVIAYILSSPSIPLLNSGNVVPRDAPEILESDPSPVCVVTVLDERPVIDGGHKTNTDQTLDYPVFIILARKILLSPRSDPWKKTARWMLKQKLHRPFLLGHPGLVNRCKYNPQPEFPTNTVGLPIGWKVSPQLFVYRVTDNMDGTANIQSS